MPLNPLFERHLLGTQDRSLKLAFWIDPLERLNPWRDSTIAMMRAAEKHGHQVFAFEQGTLSWQAPSSLHPPTLMAHCQHLHIRSDEQDWYRETEREWRPLGSFDAVLIRKHPPFDEEYLASTWLLERGEAQGVRIINRPRALRDHSQYLALAEFPQFTSPTLISRNAAQLEHFVEQEDKVMLRSLHPSNPEHVFWLHRSDPNRSVLIDTLTQQGRKTVIAQADHQDPREANKRILMIGGKVVPYALARIASERRQHALGLAKTTAVAQELSPRDREIAEFLAPILLKRGIVLAGLDVVGHHLRAIHVCNPGGMVEIRQQTAFDAAGVYMSTIEHVCGLP